MYTAAGAADVARCLAEECAALTAAIRLLRNADYIPKTVSSGSALIYHSNYAIPRNFLPRYVATSEQGISINARLLL